MIGRDKKTFLLLALWAGLFFLLPAHAQLVNLTTPIFQFEVFYYEGDMEIRPGPNMYFNGLVHGNKDIYFSPGADLVFTNLVTSGGSIYFNKKSGDQQSEGGGTTTFLGGSFTNVNHYFYQPYYAGDFTNGAHGLVDIPPPTESAVTGIGTNRLYHQVDMIVLVSNTTVTVRGGYQVNNEAVLPGIFWTNFISTNVTFLDTREAATIRAVTLNVGRLRLWDATNTGAGSIRAILGRNIDSIYIADLRTMASTQEAGICLTNGKYLPPLGLTVVTPDPVYTMGDYNTTTDGFTFYPGTSYTDHTLPAAIMSDAINILSAAWNSAQSTNTLSNGGRQAVDTTVNAAFLTGFVETTNVSFALGFSGGLENLPRFLEDWSNHTFTWNGSMVAMFDSVVAKNVWLPTGSAYNSYNAPTRQWAFDNNFLTAEKLPPLTPALVNPPAVILSAPPATNNGVLGQSFTFSVTATNYAPVSSLLFYQWYFNNTVLVNATNSFLTLTNLQTNQAGVYKVEIHNLSAIPTNASANLTINFSPAVTAQFTNLAVSSGQTTNFSVSVNGTPPFYYQWRKNGSKQSGSTNSSLSFAPTMTTHSGSYDVIITNAWGATTSAVAVLKVTNSPPVITAFLTNLNVKAGQSITLVSGASGNPAPNFFWFKNGSFLSNGITSMTLAAALTADAGTYVFLATNFSGAASNAAVVTVLKNDTLTLLGALTSSAAVQPVDFTATVSAAAGPPTGQVEFRDATNSLGFAALSGTNATLSAVNLTAGEHPITAFYSGDANFNASVSLTVTQRLGFYLYPPVAPAGGLVQFSGSGDPGLVSVLELSDFIVFPPVWTPVETNVSDTNGFFHFSPVVSTNDGVRVYRLRQGGP